VDLPEALIFSGTYLALTIPECQPTVVGPKAAVPARHSVTLTPNYAFKDMLCHLPRVDLVLNFASMGEMTQDQVESYARELSAKMHATGLVFESNVPAPAAEWVKASAKDILGKHFAANEAVDWTGIPQFDGWTCAHANRPLDTMLVPRQDRMPLLLATFCTRFGRGP
jgi:hypothetical protein